MKKNNFLVSCCDTDSITLSKADKNSFSLDEINQLLKEVNSIMPELVQFEYEAKYEKVIVLKAKNYVLYDPENPNPKKRLIIKGSSLKSPTLELALREFINEIIWTILKEEYNYQNIYLKYVREIMNVQDMKRWTKRQTITDKTLKSERTNESKVRDAIEDSEYSEGSRIWTYFKSDESLDLIENFNGDYHKDKLLVKLFKAGNRFNSIINTKEIFLNFSLKRNKEILNQI